MYKRINILFWLAITILGVACKKETKPEETAPVSGPTGTTKTNTVTWFVAAYDSVGDNLTDRSGIAVSFSGTSHSATTNSMGIATMTGVAAGELYPVAVKAGYEQAPYSLSFTANNPLSLNVIIARNSPYKLTLTSAPNLVNKDSITINFFLNKSIPAGKNIKIAVLTHTASTVGVNDYAAVDYLMVNGINTNFTNKNIAKLTNVANYLANSVNTWQKCYFALVPVTYGSVLSNTLNKEVLIGDNLPVPGSPTATMQITKNW